MPEVNFTYDGAGSAGYNLSVLDILRPILPAITARTLSIPTRPGLYYIGSEMGAREIQIEISLDSMTSMEAVRQQIRTIAAWLNPLRGERRLILDDEPDKYYNAVLSSDTDFEQIKTFGKGKLTFLCADPFAYALDETRVTTFNPGPSAYPNSREVSIDGTAPISPIFELTVTSAGDSLRVQHISSGKTINVARVFAVGDVITVDNDARKVFLNGASIMNNVALTSRFFQFQPGVNSFDLTGGFGFDLVLRYVPRWY